MRADSVRDDSSQGREVERPAVVTKILSETEVLGHSVDRSFAVNDRIILKSQSEKVGVIAYLAIEEVYGSDVTDQVDQSKGFDFRAKLLRGSARYMIRPGDILFHADLAKNNESYGAKIELIDPEDSGGLVSSRYRSLYTQGFSIGEAAQTLKKDEFLIAWYGLFAYGATDWLSVSSYLPLNALGAPNAQLKFRFYNSTENKLATGLNFSRIPGSKESVFNLSLMWDSFSSSSIVSHSFLTVAALTYDNSKETTAIKSFGSSAIQSGYEFLLPNWSRVLLGPNYNFETKALGGYISYLKIWEHFHFQLSLASNNLAATKLDVKEGYFGFIDGYWRY